MLSSTDVGKRWLEDQDAAMIAKDQCLQLRKLGGLVQSSKRLRGKMEHVKRPEEISVKELDFMLGTVPICKASIEDIFFFISYTRSGAF
ncbi:hypothetical protein K3495_g11099 [Podosphaera aphanis]|nr:hypothetical protein K3495_g11099 [Podosphaera aphanis]